MVRMETETYFEERQDGTVHMRARRTRCKLCGIDTIKGHPLTGCVFTLAQRVRQQAEEIEALKKELTKKSA